MLAKNYCLLWSMSLNAEVLECHRSYDVNNDSIFDQQQDVTTSGNDKEDDRE